MKKISLIKNKKHVIYAKKRFVWIKMMKIIKIKEMLKITAITQENLEELSIANAYKVPKDIPIILHNASYDTHFIINQLAEEFKRELNCIGENMEKYITFSVPIKKECDDNKTIAYKLRCIDSLRFMPTSLSELVDNLSGKICNSIVCKKCMEREKINSKCEFDGLKDNRLLYKCRECGEMRYDSINGLIKKFSSTYQFCNSDLNKFILLL